MLAVFKREFLSYFKTPSGYVFMAMFLAVNGGVFSVLTLQQQDGSLSSYFMTMTFALVVLIPILTMKSFSEERKTRTEQLLLTSPTSLGGIVFGKFLAAFTLFAATYAVGCINFTALYKFAAEDKPNGGQILGCSVALLLIGAAFIAAGVFMSSLTENQLIASLGTMGIMVLFLVIGMLNQYIPFEWLRTVLSWISIYSRFSNFTYGVFDFAAVLYYVSVSFVFLFLTVRVYERRRWA